MIYKILDKEEIGELKEELSCGLPGTAKVYISSWFVFWTLGIHFIHVQLLSWQNIYFFLIMFFKPDQEAKKKGEK